MNNLGKKVNHLFKKAPEKLIYSMSPLFSNFLKKCDCKEHKPPKILKIGKICFWMPYLGVNHVFL